MQKKYGLLLLVLFLGIGCLYLYSNNWSRNIKENESTMGPHVKVEEVIPTIKQNKLAIYYN